MSKVLLSIWLLWMSVLDIRSKSVPTWLIWLGGGLVLAISVAESFTEITEQGSWWSYISVTLCGIIPGGFLLLLAFATKAVGYGDGIVLAMLGAVSGMQKSVLVLCAALFLVAIGSVILLVMRKVKRNTCLPFLPFVAAGWFLVGMR